MHYFQTSDGLLKSPKSCDCECLFLCSERKKNQFIKHEKRPKEAFRLSFV